MNSKGQQRSFMRKPSDPSRPLKTTKTVEDAGPQSGRTQATAANAWPFEPGSQQGKQVAKPWFPKTPYRFNQR
jgi:hypothetical protein